MSTLSPRAIEGLMRREVQHRRSRASLRASRESYEGAQSAPLSARAIEGLVNRETRRREREKQRPLERAAAKLTSGERGALQRLLLAGGQLATARKPAPGAPQISHAVAVRLCRAGLCLFAPDDSGGWAVVLTSRGHRLARALRTGETA